MPEPSNFPGDFPGDFPGEHNAHFSASIVFEWNYARKPALTILG